MNKVEKIKFFNLPVSHLEFLGIIKDKVDRERRNRHILVFKTKNKILIDIDYQTFENNTFSLNIEVLDENYQNITKMENEIAEKIEKNIEKFENLFQ